MAISIRLKRGLKAALPASAPSAEPHYATDTQEIFLGSGASMLPLRMAPANVIGLLSGGKIDTALLPNLAITDVNVVADIIARDALTVQEGDVAVVLDDGSGNKQSYIYDGTAWVTLDDADGVASVNGQTGAVVLDTDDIAEGTTNLYYTDARVATYIATQINAANGIAGLDASGKLSVSVLPATVVQAGEDVTRLGSTAQPEFSLVEADGAGATRWTQTVDGGTF